MWRSAAPADPAGSDPAPLFTVHFHVYASPEYYNQAFRRAQKRWKNSNEHTAARFRRGPSLPIFWACTGSRPAGRDPAQPASLSLCDQQYQRAEDSGRETAPGIAVLPQITSPTRTTSSSRSCVNIEMPGAGILPCLCRGDALGGARAGVSRFPRHRRPSAGPIDRDNAAASRLRAPSRGANTPCAKADHSANSAILA